MTGPFKMRRAYGHWFTGAVLGLCLACSTVAVAQKDREITRVAHNIYIGPNENVDELTCFGCSVRIRGHVAGDVTTFGGSITLEQGEIGGDVTTFGGNVRLDKATAVGGDVAVFGGRINREPEARVSGDVTASGGPGWLIPILLAPFLALGLLMALVIWIVQRLRRPAVPAAAA